jgi:phage FluMu protein Com
MVNNQLSQEIMEAIAQEKHACEVQIPCKRFSKISYPSSEQSGKQAIKVTKPGTQSGYLCLCCAECDTTLILEPTSVHNVHQNLGRNKDKYAVIKLGATCPKCKKADQIKIPLDSQFVLDLEKATRSEHKLPF